MGKTKESQEKFKNIRIKENKQDKLGIRIAQERQGSLSLLGKVRDKNRDNR
jgi:hypothetical protein